jgi:capsular polysaccharide export protein
VCSPFFSCLARKLHAAGHQVSKANFTVGDAIYWRNGNARNFRGDLRALPAFLDNLYDIWGVTDQVLFGDRRPIHRAAIERGRARNIRTHVYEEGYFRPHWVTLERDGVNAHSRLPRDAGWFREVGARLPDCGSGESFQASFGVRALHDVAYHAAGFWNPLLFPHYRNHAPTNAATEYAGYVRRLPRTRRLAQQERQRVRELVQGDMPFFFFPLQLGSDAQILDHSRYGDMLQVARLIMTSFAEHADGDARLVVKNHPLDTGCCDYPREIQAMARMFGVADRVDYIESGDLHLLLSRARGVVTVNSTVGLLALGLACPTIALGAPIYALPGLTFQGALEDFWRAPTLPDMALYRQFRKVVIHATQVNGGFYSREGIDLAITHSVPALLAEQSPLEALI